MIGSSVPSSSSPPSVIERPSPPPQQPTRTDAREATLIGESRNLPRSWSPLASPTPTPTPEAERQLRTFLSRLSRHIEEACAAGEAACLGDAIRQTADSIGTDLLKGVDPQRAHALLVTQVDAIGRRLETWAAGVGQRPDRQLALETDRALQYLGDVWRFVIGCSGRPGGPPVAEGVLPDPAALLETHVGLAWAVIDARFGPPVG